MDQLEFKKICISQNVAKIKKLRNHLDESHCFELMYWSGIYCNISMLEIGLPICLKYKYALSMIWPFLCGMVHRGKDFDEKCTNVIYKLLFLQKSLITAARRRVGGIYPAIVSGDSLLKPEQVEALEENCIKYDSPVYDYLCSFVFAEHFENTKYYNVLKVTNGEPIES
jgi:hypothetical protein